MFELGIFYKNVLVTVFYFILFEIFEYLEQYFYTGIISWVYIVFLHQLRSWISWRLTKHVNILFASTLHCPLCAMCVANSVTSVSENKCTVMSKLSNSKRKRMYVCPHMPCFTKHCLSGINLLFFIYRIIYIYFVTQYSGSCV